MKFNLIYFLTIIGIIILGFFSYKYILNSNEHFGIAENQTRIINLDYPVEIKKINVVLGQSIEAGDLICQVYRTDLPIKFNDINFEIAELNSRTQIEVDRIQSNLKRLNAEKNLTITRYQDKIKQVEIENKLNLQALNSIQTLEIPKIENELVKQKILSIQNEFLNESKVIEADINKTKNELGNTTKPISARISKLENEKLLLKHQENALNIYAPQSGIVGELNLKDGEKIDAYTSILKIYDTRPNIVTTYIVEGYKSNLIKNQVLDIYSIQDPNYIVKGKVIGLGTRILLLPERLRKIPEVKIWGKEVQLQINPKNNFLQGEKVRILFP